MTLKITIAQISPIVGDVTGNLKLMKAAADRAVSDRADLVVFPELSLIGYHPGDLLDEPEFLNQISAGLEILLLMSRSTPGLHWVVGAPTRREGPGKRLHNSLLVMKDGELVLHYAKQLLPTYNIFDERRHFEPGPEGAHIREINGRKVGFMICEDGWNDDGQDYRANPLTQLDDAKAELVISINASPSNIGKREQRHALFTAASRRHGFPIVYVNQVGGNDQLVFDGASFAVTPDKGLVFEAKRFQPDVTTLLLNDGYFTDIETQPLGPVSAGLSPMEFYHSQIVLGLRDYASRCGFKSVVVGCSGGIDSALTIALAVEALGPRNVDCITMPSAFSSKGSVTDSDKLCHNLGLPLIKHPIHNIFAEFCAAFKASCQGPLKGLAAENLQARIRGTILMAYSNAYGPLVLTTGNKSEISVGYCTLYGDTNGGLGLLGDLYKTEVFELSRYVNKRAGRELIPQAIIDKAPSAELSPDQLDTDSLPPYPVLDAILKYLIEGERLGVDERESVVKGYNELVSTEEGEALISRIKKMIIRNEYKRRQSPPILRVRARSFGSGRQMPIAAKYDF